MAVKYYDKGNEKEAMIKVQTFILPHQDDLSKEDIEALGGMDALKDDQGFFVYRNDRLIIYGTWFRLSSRSVNAELYKYGKIVEIVDLQIINGGQTTASLTSAVLKDKLSLDIVVRERR